MGADGARVEKLRYLEKNYKWLKLWDRLVIEHQQSEKPKVRWECGAR